MTGGPQPAPEPETEQPVLTLSRGLRPEVVDQVLTAVEDALEGLGASRVRVATDRPDITVVATFPADGR